MGCNEHTNGKTCIQVIADGKCLKGTCPSFPKVLRMIPKLKKLREMQAKGIIIHTVWDFSEKAECRRLANQKKAEKWLNEFYPRIIENLSVKIGSEARVEVDESLHL